MPRKRTGHLVLRGGIWHAQVTTDKKSPDGKALRDWITLDTPDGAVAKRRLARYIAEQAAGRTPEAAAVAASAPDTVGAYAAAIEKRLSDGDCGNLRRRVLPVIGSLALDAVKPAHIKGIRDTVIASNARRGNGKHVGAEVKVLDRKVRRETVSKVLGAMRRFFAAAVEDELLELNPAADWVLDSLRRPVLSAEPLLPPQLALLRPLAKTALARHSVFRVVRVCAFGGLPPAVRARFGIEWSALDAVALDGLELAVRNGWPIVPETVRWQPRALDGWRRVRAEQAEQAA